MSVQQVDSFHLNSFSQFDNPHQPAPPPPPPPPPPPLPPPSPPQQPPVTITGSQENPHHPQPHWQKPQAYDHNHTLCPPEREMIQPLDLSVARGFPPSADSKRTMEESCEERCAKRARIEDVANPAFPSFGLENGSGLRGIPATTTHDYFSQTYSSLPYCSSSDHEKFTQENASSGAPPLSQQFPSSSSSAPADVLGKSLPPYYQPVHERQGHPFYGSEPSVSASVSAVCGSEVKHKESSAGVSLGLPIPHNSVFTRSVSPLFQQSWHHSPMSVSSHVHHTLFHTASSVSPHLHPDAFQLPLPLSSSFQQGLLSSPISVSLHGHSSSLPAPGSFSAYSQHNVLPSSHQNILPSPRENVVPSPQQSSVLPPLNGVPSFPPKIFPPPQEVVASAQQNTVSPSQIDDQPTPQQKPLQPPTQSLAQSSEASPRPFYRPFEDTTRPSPQIPPPTVSVSSRFDGIAMDSSDYRSQSDLSASSSATVSSSSTSVSVGSSDHKSSTDEQQTKVEQGGPDPAVLKQGETEEKQNEIPQSSSHTSDSSLASLPKQNVDASPAQPQVTFAIPTKPASSIKRSAVDDAKPSGRKIHPKPKVNPIQDNAVLSSTSLEPPLNKPSKGKGRKPATQPLKVTGTTLLAKMRQDRERQEAKAREERLREFMTRRQEYLSSGGQRGCQIASISDSDRQASPNSSGNNKEEDGRFQTNNDNGIPEKQAKLQPHSAEMNSDGRERASTSSMSKHEDGEIPSSSQGEATSHFCSDDIDGKRASPCTRDNAGVNEATSPPPDTSNTSDDRLEDTSSEPGSDQPSSSSSGDSSKSKSADGAPIPPDPNLKISLLDYLISKVLVERIDVPFKPENREIRAIYTGAKEGRLTFVDLIELQVEASLKA